MLLKILFFIRLMRYRLYVWTKNTTIIFFLWPHSPEPDSLQFQVSDETTK